MTLRNVRNMRQEAMDFGTQGFDFGGQATMDYTPPDENWYRAEAEAAARRAEERRQAEARKRADEARQQAAKERAERDQREREADEARKRHEERRRQRDASTAPDPYSVLGIDPMATSAEIRAAWSRLCKVYHPDTATGDIRKMQAVNDAYSRLKGRRP